MTHVDYILEQTASGVTYSPHAVRKLLRYLAEALDKAEARIKDLEDGQHPGDYR